MTEVECCTLRVGGPLMVPLLKFTFRKRISSSQIIIDFKEKSRRLVI